MILLYFLGLMKMRNILLAFYITVGWCTSALAERSCLPGMPSFSSVRSNHSNDLTSMFCEPAPGEVDRVYRATGKLSYEGVQRINCQFAQTLFRKTDPAEIKQGIEKMRAEDKDGSSPDAICKSASEIEAGMKKNPDLGPKMKKITMDFLEACRSRSPDKINSAFENLLLVDSRKCKTTQNPWTTEFKRVGPQKWLNQSGPTGLCDLVKVETLECDENGFWEYKSTRVDVNSSTELCKDMKEGLNKPMITAYRFNRPIEMDCEFIE